MENHLNSLIGIIIGILLSVLFILLLWGNHKVWCVILIILSILLGVFIGDYFDRERRKTLEYHYPDDRIPISIKET